MEQFFPKDRRVNLNEQHTAAEDLMFEADAADREGNMQSGREIRLRAARLEEESLNQIPSDQPRTRAIIGSSAVSLYYKAGNFEDVKRLGEPLIEEIDPVLYAYNRDMILEMLAEVNRQQQTPSQ